ncbi:MAG TPA: glycosyltransferase [Candidatus Omnitrophota bacterium]|mgnify:CR=1 FL=1|nr:glycosyltransferase [Candidatus Omnitrophota bacterium]
MKQIRTLLLYAQNSLNRDLSYQYGWPRQFCAADTFDCIPINIAFGNRFLNNWYASRVKKGDFDAIILLHSVLSNECYLRGELFDAVRKSNALKVYFIGNEYKMMPLKMQFCENLKIKVLISQSNAREVHDLYRARLNGCMIAYLPNTGLDTALFFPKTAYEKRPIDIGYRSYEAPWYLGNNEKSDIATRFQEYLQHERFIIDISLEKAKRLNEKNWAQFLDSCKGQLGTESGGDYFELTDATRIRVNNYLNTHPHATFQEIFEIFFKNYGNSVTMRILSSRNIEAAGTKTVQILFEGHYNGHFQADVHYIPLRKDFSNREEVIRKLKDVSLCQEIALNAYTLVLEEFTYEKLLNRLHDTLNPLLS